jgi:hypothetical protein
MSDPWATEEGQPSLSLAEHTPRTAAEAGLVFGEVPPLPYWRSLLVASVTLAVVGIVSAVAQWGDDDASIVDLDVGACFEPITDDLEVPVETVDCGPGTARLLARERHPAERDELHPGDGALELFGQGACQGLVDAEQLVVVVPSPAAWAAGERIVACTQRL